MFSVTVPVKSVAREAEELQVALASVEADLNCQEQSWPAAAATDNNIEIDAIGSIDSIDMQMQCMDPLLDSRHIRSVDMLEDKQQLKMLANSLVVELFSN